jgi:hypothetical protein
MTVFQSIGRVAGKVKLGRQAESLYNLDIAALRMNRN